MKGGREESRERESQNINILKDFMSFKYTAFQMRSSSRLFVSDGSLPLINILPVKILDHNDPHELSTTNLLIL